MIPPHLAHLAPGRSDRLGAYRREELREAMRRLGVSSAVLGEDPDAGVLSRYRDSGMAGTADNHHAEAFCNADLEEAARRLVLNIRKLRPQVLVTYNENGGYGHPDHIMANRVTQAAFELAGDRVELEGACVFYLEGQAEI